MRIDLNPRAVEELGKSAPGQPLDKASASQTRSHPAVEESSFQSRLQALESAALSSPEVRQDKVDRIARALRDGSYQVAPDQIAGAMLAEGSR